MRTLRCTPRTLLALAVTTWVAAGCAHVGQDQFDSEVADLRRMIQENESADAERAGRRADETRSLESRLSDVEREIRALNEELTDLDATIVRMDAALRVHVPVYFGFDDATVPESSRTVLGRFAEVVAEYYPAGIVTVEGFTDPTGTPEYNLALGQRRADAVRATLLEHGLGEDRVRSVSYGEDTGRLLSSDGGRTTGAENRRVVLVLEGPPVLQSSSSLVSGGGVER